jgi:flagellar basal-body rod protein FlgF
VDRYLYVTMSGAKETLRAQASNSHNLANASTTGFRADLAAFMSRALEGPGYDSRAYATTSSIGWSRDQGAVATTGRDLDVAVRGEGWLAVQGADGREAYTRAGDLRLDANGQLRNGAGHVVLGDDGPLAVPESSAIAVGIDGTVSVVPIGQGPETIAEVGRIKLVNPPAADLERGADGLFRLRDGTDAPADAGVRLAVGSLESSNVNAAQSMVQMIELSRRFDMQLKAMRTAEEDARAAASLLRL